MTTKRDIIDWINEDLGRFAPSGYIEVYSEASDVKFKFYTDTNCYTIRASGEIVEDLPEDLPKDVAWEYPHSYLGCVAESRKPRAGESWTRGRDLSDGLYNKSTWDRIKSDILSYELVKIHSKPVELNDGLGQTSSNLDVAGVRMTESAVI